MTRCASHASDPMAILFARSLSVPVWMFVFGMVFMSSAATEPSRMSLVSWALAAFGVMFVLRMGLRHLFHQR